MKVENISTFVKETASMGILGEKEVLLVVLTGVVEEKTCHTVFLQSNIQKNRC